MRLTNKVTAIAIAAVLLSVSVFAQTQRGTWTADISKKDTDKLHLNMFRSSERGQMGSSYTFSELGLTRAIVEGTNVQTDFRLQRDAGNVEFHGTFNQGLGHGEFNFTANQEYLAAMKQMGYTDVDRKSFELAMLDVSRAYAKEIRDLGFKTNLEELIEARIFNVNREQVEGLRAVGVTNLPMKKLVEYRIFDVTPEYVKQMRASFPNISVDKMVEMRIHKATPEFAKEMANLGYSGLSADKLVEFRIHGVTPEFIREVGELGFKNLNADMLVQFRIFGVNADQIKELAKEGYTNLSAQKLVEFRIHHVDGAFIEKVKRAGYAHPSPDQLVEFKILGIRVKEADL